MRKIDRPSLQSPDASPQVTPELIDTERGEKSGIIEVVRRSPTKMDKNKIISSIMKGFAVHLPSLLSLFRSTRGRGELRIAARDSIHHLSPPPKI